MSDILDATVAAAGTQRLGCHAQVHNCGCCGDRTVLAKSPASTQSGAVANRPVLLTHVTVPSASDARLSPILTCQSRAELPIAAHPVVVQLSLPQSCQCQLP